MYARVTRCDAENVALEFVEHDLIAEAIVQDLMFFQRQERRKQSRKIMEPAPALEACGVAETS